MTGWALGREADSLAGMIDRKARVRTGLGFVVSHPCRKDRVKDGAPGVLLGAKERL